MYHWPVQINRLNNGDTIFYRAAPDTTSRPIISYNDLDQPDTDMF